MYRHPSSDDGQGFITEEALAAPDRHRLLSKPRRLLIVNPLSSLSDSFATVSLSPTTACLGLLFGSLPRLSSGSADAELTKLDRWRPSPSIKDKDDSARAGRC